MTKGRIYLAGPEVFMPNAAEIGAAKKALCEQHGFIGLCPFDDAASERPGERKDRAIYRENLAMIRAADFLIANLTPFRGPSADVGTVFELGLALGLGKVVFGYTNVGARLIDRVRQGDPATSQDHAGDWRDGRGMLVEDFGNADNLMIDACLAEVGHEIVVTAADPAVLYGDLTGVTACLHLAAAARVRSAASWPERTAPT